MKVLDRLGPAARGSALGLLVCCGASSEEHVVPECLVARVGGVDIHSTDVERARTTQVPALDAAQARRLLIEATLVWLSSAEPKPNALDPRAALDAHRRFLAREEHAHQGGPPSEWLASAQRKIHALEAELGVEPGSCPE